MNGKTLALVGRIVKTVVSVLLAVVLAIAMMLVNSLVPQYSKMGNSFIGGINQHFDNSAVDTTNVDLDYNKADYDSESIKAAEDEMAEQIAGEGTVLLKNDDQTLPIERSRTLSFFGASSAGGPSTMSSAGFGGGATVTSVFSEDGFSVNQTLADYYENGNGKDYGLASGSISFGDDEDFSINEAPLSALESEAGLLDSAEGTLPVFVFSRVAGEGRDMPRSMVNHADNPEDQAKTYLEPDSTELELLDYLNSNFDEVVLLVKSNATLDLDWVADYPNIKAIVYSQEFTTALPKIFAGDINPSGRTVDTYATDALASPAAQNFGDYQYVDENGELTKYNYVTYEEGIYVGYKYYETRYEDAVLGQGNAGDYDYATEVLYPFGYGLSYTEFEWSDYELTRDGDEFTAEVTVTNTGDVAGKDVVELYTQSPYTGYDKANKVEKPSVALVGYGKTDELAPGESQTVTVTFDKEQLKSYDYTTAKTYIFDAGDYRITAASDAHAAINNILADKGMTAADGVVGEVGDPAFVETYTAENTDVDVTTYANDSDTDAEVTNLFDDAAGDATYLTRNDWVGTFPTHDGEASDVVSTWGNEVNGENADGTPASYLWVKTASDELLAQLDGTDSGTPIDRDSITDTPVYGEENGLSLIDMRGLDFDDAQWDDLLDQLSEEDYESLLLDAGYGVNAIESVGKPFNIDADSAAGLVYGGTGKTFPVVMMLAQTWNQELAEDYGEMIGNEALLGGADGWYAPSMNIHRTPFSGRNGEYYSEDAFLSGTVASREVYGAATKGVYAYIKHYALNDQENHRGDREGQYGLATWSNEQAIREIYLKPFEMCMKVDDVELNYVQRNADGTYENATRTTPASKAVMSAFNRIGATWTGGSYSLIGGVLRNEWGFQGMVITDNANTGVFMNGYQMWEAGADTKLTQQVIDPTGYEPDWTDSATYKYARDAAHRVLYTVANSKAMNGAMPGSELKQGMYTITVVQIVINVVLALLIALLLFFSVWRWLPKTIARKAARKQARRDRKAAKKAARLAKAEAAQ
ncbi:glycoside hydrolase family 3 N-terminal domain-containing protein [Bifidobacterium eulemuris]|uniref:Beta-glucosidase n=1 Tax=Bifidobacterium eulemuris TaxID=1765219 RepID=A0A261G207_9BIFI|nr:glycoside hydrolase family 3 N-terminal domain-containing protein [Bifidobacterium eulemuris]OZG65275.1 beta-glucosidase [Bifidobacterium eulemuris]QOL32310.1 glycoside hydrolase family 3 C-terminal domain-containing protein [Bifidobacterium eulemuris]